MSSVLCQVSQYIADALSFLLITWFDPILEDEIMQGVFSKSLDRTTLEMYLLQLQKNEMEVRVCCPDHSCLTVSLAVSLAVSLSHCRTGCLTVSLAVSLSHCLTVSLAVSLACALGALALFAHSPLIASDDLRNS